MSRMRRSQGQSQQSKSKSEGREGRASRLDSLRLHPFLPLVFSHLLGARADELHWQLHQWPRAARAASGASARCQIPHGVWCVGCRVAGRCGRLCRALLVVGSHIAHRSAFDSRWVPPVGGAPSRRTSTSTRRCVRHQRCNDWVTKPSA
jgi:hypothetical protein